MLFGDPRGQYLVQGRKWFRPTTKGIDVDTPSQSFFDSPVSEPPTLIDPTNVTALRAALEHASETMIANSDLPHALNALAASERARAAAVAAAKRAKIAATDHATARTRRDAALRSLAAQGVPPDQLTAASGIGTARLGQILRAAR